MGFSLFLPLNFLLNQANYFISLGFSFLICQKRERKGGVGINLSSTVCASNLANTGMANRFHHLFQLRFVDSGFLERCLEKDSEEAQQECFS